MKPITDARPQGPRVLAIVRRLAPFLVLVAVAVGGWFGWKHWTADDTGPVYATSEVARGNVLQTVTASGTLSPVLRSTVGSQVSGRITEILVDFNDEVKKGQVLARLDPQVLQGQVTQAQARLTSARAELARARATATNARVEDQRTQKALELGAVSRSEADASRAARLVAEASIQNARSSIVEAEAALANAKTNLAYTTITAPIDGVIISRSVDAGQTVAASLQAPELFVIAGDLAQMELHAAVAEADVGQLRDGMRVELAFDAYPERTFEGRVKQVRNQATTTQNVVTYAAVVAVDNADGALRPGMTATATFVVAEARDELVVSAKALRYRPAAAAAAAMSGRATAGNGRAAASGRATAASGSEPGARTDGAEGPRRRGGPRTAVWVLRGGFPVRVAVEVGLSDGTTTAIRPIGGLLLEGDRVITGENGGSATPAAPANGGARGGQRGQRGPGFIF